MSEDLPAIVNAARERDEFIAVAKARVVEARSMLEKSDGGSVQGTNQVSRDDFSTAFTNLGALDPIYDPEMLSLIFEHSNSLRQNVDSYATNIDGFGHRFDPIFDLTAPDVDDRIAHAMTLDAQRRKPDADVPDPPADVIAAMKEKIKKRMRREESTLKYFFESCVPDMSFVTLRRWTRQDLEVMGNAYWEALRNLGGDLAQFVYVPGFTIRLLPLDLEPVTIMVRVRVSELDFEDVELTKRFRRYVQIVEGRTVFFKEFGDPRLVSNETGQIYPDVDTMREQEPKARPATEIIHFKIHSPRSAYGVPRWIGNLLAVIGSRQAEEVNFNYFENKSVPPLVVLVSGGRISENSVTRMQDYIEANIKGKRNFHKILVLEAEGQGGDQNAANASRMKIDVKPLTGAQHSDALFQNYDERNIDKVGQSFRLPRMLRGDIRDFNRATSESALTFAEVQVFEPERQEFDFIINRKILHVLKIQFWRFVSLAPVLRDPAAMSEIIKNLSNAFVITPEEGRELAGDVFNRDFKRLDAAWVKQPGAFTQAGIPYDPGGKPRTIDPNRENFGPEGGEIAPNRPPGEGVEARAPIGKRAMHQAIVREAARLLAVRSAIEHEESAAWADYLLRKAQAEGAAHALQP